MGSETARGRGKWLVVVALGLGLVVAPVIFQMFGRAPAGGRMLDDFEPYMSAPVLEGFTADLDLIDRAVDEARGLEIPDDLAALPAPAPGGTDLARVDAMTEGRIDHDRDERLWVLGDVREHGFVQLAETGMGTTFSGEVRSVDDDMARHSTT